MISKHCGQSLVHIGVIRIRRLGEKVATRVHVWRCLVCKIRFKQRVRTAEPKEK